MSRCGWVRRGNGAQGGHQGPLHGAASTARLPGARQAKCHRDRALAPQPGASRAREGQPACACCEFGALGVAGGGGTGAQPRSLMRLEALGCGFFSHHTPVRPICTPLEPTLQPARPSAGGGGRRGRDSVPSVGGLMGANSKTPPTPRGPCTPPPPPPHPVPHHGTTTAGSVAGGGEPRRWRRGRLRPHRRTPSTRRAPRQSRTSCTPHPSQSGRKTRNGGMGGRRRGPRR